ncbi:hypothetical protein EYF80_025237 [Liparis tanakae]|uniref:Uncharacterized protein n=1 Tax=Liparis tanakae TaxID=230148 RepID=A0A4Z2HF71_9TELE|nr:hypothetical protein EYF80_025237 [Liparis tanakae]
MCNFRAVETFQTLWKSHVYLSERYSGARSSQWAQRMTMSGSDSWILGRQPAFLQARPHQRGRDGLKWQRIGLGTDGQIYS